VPRLNFTSVTILCWFKLQSKVLHWKQRDCIHKKQKKGGRKSKFSCFCRLTIQNQLMHKTRNLAIIIPKKNWLIDSSLQESIIQKDKTLLQQQHMNMMMSILCNNVCDWIEDERQWWHIYYLFAWVGRYIPFSNSQHWHLNNVLHSLNDKDAVITMVE